MVKKHLETIRIDSQRKMEEKIKLAENRTIDKFNKLKIDIEKQMKNKSMRSPGKKSFT